MNEKPTTSNDETWHVHDDGTWEWGAVCTICKAPIVTPQGMPYFNIKRLQADNAGHYTQRELEREVTDAARADKREIERAG